MTEKSHDASRRAFLRHASALSVVGVGTPLAINLAAMGEACASTASDYKAIVCVFLNGGNDYANTLIPYDQTNYNAYNGYRPTIAIARSALTNTVLAPTMAPVDTAGFSRQFALAPTMDALLPLFNAGKMGVLLNVGNLIEPATKQQLAQGTVARPPTLFSHSDQTNQWQSLSADAFPSGWGGRIGDLFEAGNTSPLFTSVSVAGNALFATGKRIIQYQTSPADGASFGPVASPLRGSTKSSEAVVKMMSQASGHLMENDHIRVSKRMIDSNEAWIAALRTATEPTTPFPIGNSLGDQLKKVARIISCASALGAKRQIFYVGLGGFDTHGGVLSIHPGLVKKVADAIAAFYAATVELGVANQVTTFTASEFGRSLTSNGDGSDHGWGSMHFVLGGAVNGKKYYGTPPAVASNGPDDTGNSALIPTTSIDQYAATIGKWMGVSDSNLLSILPNLRNFNASTRNLGFI